MFLDKPLKQDIAGPLSSRASRVLGPISRCRVAGHVAPHETCFACFSSWDTRWFLSHPMQCPLALHTDFHTVEHDHTCRVGCPNELDSLNTSQ